LCCLVLRSSGSAWGPKASASPVLAGCAVPRRATLIGRLRILQSVRRVTGHRLCRGSGDARRPLGHAGHRSGGPGRSACASPSCSSRPTDPSRGHRPSGLGEVRGNAAEAVPSAAEHVVDAGDAFELLERDTRAIRA
jgi:hypothetical protein